MVQKKIRTGGRTDGFAPEFMPPLGEPASWGPPWEQQLEAVRAWQEAGAAADGEACQWRGPAAGDGAALTMQTIVRLNTLNVSLRERLLQITNEASNIAIAQMAAHEQGAAGAPSASPVALDEEQARQLVELARTWFDLVAAAQHGMSALTGLPPRAGLPEAARRAQQARPFADRRQCAIDIGFADRRKAG